MNDEELKDALKEIIFDESRDEQKTPEDGFAIGKLSNQDILNNIQSIIEYHKTSDNGES